MDMEPVMRDGERSEATSRRLLVIVLCSIREKHSDKLKVLVLNRDTPFAAV